MEGRIGRRYVTGCIGRGCTTRCTVGCIGSGCIAGQGLRVVGLATKTFTKLLVRVGREDEAGMLFRGFLAFLDPPKESAIPCIKTLYERGVSIKACMHTTPHLSLNMTPEQRYIAMNSSATVDRNVILAALRVCPMASGFGFATPVIITTIFITLLYWQEARCVCRQAAGKGCQDFTTGIIKPKTSM